MADRRQIAWQERGLLLAAAERTNAFEQGDWYLEGVAHYGRAAVLAIVKSTAWRGVKWDSLRNYASIARFYPPGVSRYLDVSPSHYQAARVLGFNRAMQVLKRAAAGNWILNELRGEVRRIRHWKPATGPDIAVSLPELITKRRQYRGLLVDCPWRWEVTDGHRLSGESYYDSMSDEELCALPLDQIGTDDSFLFLWCSPGGLKRGIAVMEAWGYSYKGEQVWDKETPGGGSYWRYQHENLLLGVRAKSPTHFIDRTLRSVLRSRRRGHSEKPDVHAMIEKAIGGPWIEVFARRPVERKGWTALGNQLPTGGSRKRRQADGPAQGGGAGRRKKRSQSAATRSSSA